MMLAAPKRQEIDHRTIKLIVGIVALSLATLTRAFAATPIASVSASYYEGGWSQSIFIGFLFAIAAFLLAYNGFTKAEMIFSKVASFAVLGVALFPCECGTHPALVPYVHGASAAVMFMNLAYFCYAFYQRARETGYPESKFRAAVFTGCGVTIVMSIVTLTFDYFSHGALVRSIPRFVFYSESVALIAFGISWLTASRTLPLVTRKAERFSPLRADNPS